MRASKHSPLLAVAVIVALLAGLPVASVGLNIFVGGTSATWSHLAATVLPEYILNSLWLCLGVGVGVGTLGVTTAWLTAMHDFPGRRFFEWALVLPLAMPAYVMAYVYTDFLQFVGPLQTALREAFGWQHGDYWFPDVRSLPGAILMFVCVLYPYVYLLVRTAFLERASGMLEAARTLGMGPWRAFFAVSLPLARPAIVAGVALALMETLADYGTVAYFAVNTFTTGIYRAWFSLGDRVAAAQLAAMLLSFVLFLLMAERISRGRARYHLSAAAAPWVHVAGAAAAQDGADRGRCPVRRTFPAAVAQQFPAGRCHRGDRRPAGTADGVWRAPVEEHAGERPQPAGWTRLRGAGRGHRRRGADSGDAPRQLAGRPVGALVRH